MANEEEKGQVCVDDQTVVKESQVEEEMQKLESESTAENLRQIVVRVVEKPRATPRQKGTWIPWLQEDFFKPMSYWTDECGLPTGGLVPAAITASEVSDAMLVQCFGKKERCGYKMTDCKMIDQAEILRLTQILEGYDKPMNGVLTKSLAKGLYAYFVLKVSVDWATFADVKHKNQIARAHRSKEPRLDGPPIVRVHRAYSRVLTDNDNSQVDNVNSQVDNVNSQVDELLRSAVSDVPTSLAVSDLAIVEDFSGATNVEPSPEPPSLLVKPAVDVPPESKSLETYTPQVSPWMKSKYERLKAETDCLMDSIFPAEKSLEQLRSKGKELDKMEAEAKKGVKELEAAVAIEVELNNAAKKSLQETLHELQRTTTQLEDLIDAAAGIDVESADLDACCLERQQTGLQTRLVSLNEEAKEAESQLNDTRKRLEVQQKIVSDAEVERNLNLKEAIDLSNRLDELNARLTFFQDEEKMILRYISGDLLCLKPQVIPTATEVQKGLIRVFPCAVCFLGYHCNNFIPSSCGHTYHPSCLILVVSNPVAKVPRCVTCNEIFHPDWLRCWGLTTSSPEVSQLASELDLDTQRSMFESSLEDLYTNDIQSLKRKRDTEKEKQRDVTVTYSKHTALKDLSVMNIKRKAIFIEMTSPVESAVLDPGDAVLERGGFDRPVESELDNEKKPVTLKKPKLEKKTRSSGEKSLGEKSNSHVSPNTNTRKLSLRGAGVAVVSKVELGTTDSSPLSMKKLVDVKSPPPSIAQKLKSHRNSGRSRRLSMNSSD